MKCRFLDNLTLKTLLAPETEEAFLAHHWERAPLVVHRGDLDYYGNLFTLEDFDRGIASAPQAVHTAEAKSKKHIRYEGKTSSLPLEGVMADMRGGATLLLDAMNMREPKLGLLCRLLEQQLGHSFQANLYLTPPNGQGFTPHWDNHDVFILQVLGSKHWKIEKQRRTLPGKGEAMGGDGRELRGDLYSFTLNQGDMVYIPRGFVHAGECGSELSLHITLGLTIYSWEDLLQATIKAAVLDDEGLRNALPFGFLRGGRDVLVKKAIAALRKTADEKFLSGVVDQFRDEVVRKFPLDVSGQIVDFFRPTRLTAGDAVGPRGGIVYRMHVGDDSVRLNFGARSIVFPGFFREALDFALNTPAYAIGDLPGELEDEERIVFIERLVQEGIVVRK